MAAFDGAYIPQTDGEWRAALFAELRALRGDVRELKEGLGERVRSLEETRSQQKGGFLLVKVGLAMLAPIGVLAGWIGARI